MENPLVSAIVLNFRSPQPTVECVLALLKQSLADRMEVIGVDNHSEDDSIGVLRNRLKGYGQVRIIESPRNGGFGSGYNYGVRFARGKFLLINNPDKLLQEDGVEKLVQKMEREPAVGILGPKLVHGDGTYRFSARMYPRVPDIVVKRTFLRHLFPHVLERYLQLREDPERERDADWIAGGCFLIRRDFFSALGGFDDRFFLFFEDTDFCRRCREAGKRVVYFPQMEARDRKKRLSEGGVFTLLFTRVGRAHIASGFKYFWKWGVTVPQKK